MIKQYRERSEQLERDLMAKQFLEQMHADELDRLENMGSLRIFDDGEDHSADYLASVHPEEWKVKPTIKEYHPIGSEQGKLEMEAAKKAKQRYLTSEEARVLVERLTKRKSHPKECTCEVCQPHGATNHIKSFSVKPKNKTSSHKPKHTAKKEMDTMSTKPQMGSPVRTEMTADEHDSTDADSIQKMTPIPESEAMSNEGSPITVEAQTPSTPYTDLIVKMNVLLSQAKV
jgi:hypothetical protein